MPKRTGNCFFLQIKCSYYIYLYFSAVFSTNNVPDVNGAVLGSPDMAEDLLLPARVQSNKIPCELTSAASEFPVLWYKDGILVETKDKCKLNFSEIYKCNCNCDNVIMSLLMSQ